MARRFIYYFSYFLPANILTAGRAVSATGGHMDPFVGLRTNAIRSTPGPEEGVADGKDELMTAVRFQFKKGADLPAT